MTQDQRIKQLENTVKKLEQTIEQIRARRIVQDRILPDAVKMRHVGEGIRFIRSGLAADKPTTGEAVLTGTAIYYEYDTNKLYVWDQGSESWLSTTLS